jgi:hypothetical protein
MYVRDDVEVMWQTIGHSHMRSLTPSERQELLALGKYGIGLLGFWSVGRWMDIRSRVGGGEILVLRLERDREEATIEAARARRLDETPTFTEVVIRGVEDGAARQIRPGRLQAYLASELRGQLLARDVEVHITTASPSRTTPSSSRSASSVDCCRNSRAFRARHDDARVELLVGADAERKGRVQLACGGEVLDDLASPTATRCAPWDSGRLEA